MEDNRNAPTPIVTAGRKFRMGPRATTITSAHSDTKIATITCPRTVTASSTIGIQ